MALHTATDSDFATIIASNESVVVKFYADWCGSCKLFAPKFKRLSNDERFAGVTFLEVDAENNEQSRKMAGVDNLPFIATFKGGHLVKGEATSLEDRVVALIEEIK